MNMINGWLNIDKPLGFTSAKVVAMLKKALKPVKIGHGGTLDPMASGVLPIALGEATKTVSYVMDASKVYRFSIFFGESRDTGDREGNVTAVSDNIPPEKEVQAVIPEFIGKIMQNPHKFSAIKVDGKRAYDLARAGEEFSLQQREITIHSLRLIACDGEVFDFEVKCSKGTYIRSLAIDMARRLGTEGYVYELRRTACGKFDEGNLISLAFFKKMDSIMDIERYLIPIEDTLDDISGIALSEGDAARIRHGQRLKIPDLKGEGQILKALEKGKLVAMVRADGDILRPMRIFNFD